MSLRQRLKRLFRRFYFHVEVAPPVEYAERKLSPQEFYERTNLCNCHVPDRYGRNWHHGPSCPLSEDGG